MTIRQRLGDERGESLLEVLIAVAIMGVAVVAIMAGLTTSVLMSDIHRKQSTAGAYVRDFAEAIENSVAAGNYLGCSNSAGYAALTVPDFPAAGYEKSVVGSSCSYGADVHELTLEVRSTDGRASERLVLFVRKPCTEATPC
jgi:Tfp pilus assembly protein PilV